MRSAKAPDKKRGSVILMVIALLTILAMLGSTLVMVARLDRQTSHAIASSAAPAPEVARSVLDMLRADRATDLCFAKPSGIVPYEAMTKPEDAIDYPYEDVNPGLDIDPALADIEPNALPTTKVWRHISHLRGITTYANGTAGFNNITATSDPNLADTDGDGVNDARLFESGITDPEGRPFLAAIRMIDSSGMINVNTAYDTLPAQAAPPPMLPQNVSLWRMIELASGNTTTATNLTTSISTVRPFDLQDLLCLAMDPSGETDVGRLHDLMVKDGGYVNNIWRHLTVWSQCGFVAPPYGGVATIGNRKADLNTALPSELYSGFYAMFAAGGYPPATADDAAKQMTANVLDYKDLDDDVTLYQGKYAVERQPFITKIFCRLQRDAGNPTDDTLITQVSAIELFNPYNEDILLDNYRLIYNDTTVLGTATDWAGKKVPAQRRFVAESVNTIRLDPNPPGVQPWQQLLLSGLDLFRGTLPLRLIRQTAFGDVCIDSVPGTFAPVYPPPVSQAHSTTTWRRDENRVNARYTIAVYENHPDDDSYNYYAPDATATGNMGVEDPRAAVLPVGTASCPIYIRNGDFINVGELMRILTVGPSASVSVPEQLAAQLNVNSWSSGRLDPNGSILAGSVVGVPPASLISEYFTVNKPNAAGTIEGLVNINTAPERVLRCLPAIAQLSNLDERTRVVNEIMAYRDRSQYGTAPTASSDYAFNSRAFVTGIKQPPKDLRNDPGFATSGEIAIPIRQALPNAQNVYPGTNKAPDNYAVAIDPGPPPRYLDDGFDTAVAPQDDLDKFNVYYKWLSNQVTVRSDTYIAYILVRSPAGGAAGQRDRRFVALIDRTNCRAAGDLPRVLMMAEIK